MSTGKLEDAVFRVFGLTIGTSVAAYAASAPLPYRLALVAEILPKGWRVTPPEETQ